MKHLKSFNEGILPTRLRANTLLQKVTSNTEHYSDLDARQQALHYVDNVEKATGVNVVDAEGTANESDVELELKLEDGSEVSLWYGEMNSWDSDYRQYAAPGTNDKFVVTLRTDDGNRSRNSKERKFKKLADELQDEYWQNEVYYLLKDMVPKEPTHFIKLPLDGDDVFDYDIGYNNSNEIYFLSEEDAKKWLESLTIRIIEK